MDKTIIKKIESFFESHQDAKNCFVSTDGQIFHTRRQASDYDDIIYHVSRGTNLEDWFNDLAINLADDSSTPEMAIGQPVDKTKWGWFNWLYKLLH